jgi:hypothetical protein
MVQKKLIGLLDHIKNTKSTIDRRYLKYCPETTLSIYGGGRYDIVVLRNGS